MGGGSWSADTYTTRSTAKAASGTPTFDHDHHVRTTGVYTVHEMLDPKKVAGPTSPVAGKNIRESRDSDEHPNSVPIMVLLDVTGSNITQARIIHEKLPQLFGLLLRKGYVEDPQISMGAIGDGYSDRIPVQIGEFESDNRIDETLEKIVLEGNGGGGNHESYDLGIYFAARHTVTDAWEKRGKKGYLFVIGDERAYRNVDPTLVQKWLGGDLAQPMTTEEIVREAQEKWEVYYLFCLQASYTADQVLDEAAGDSRAVAWRPLLGQNALVLDDSAAVCETIALTIGISEGTIDLDTGLAHLKEAGSTVGATVGKALAKVSGSGGSGVVAVADSPADLDTTDGGAAERL